MTTPVYTVRSAVRPLKRLHSVDVLIIVVRRLRVDLTHLNAKIPKCSGPGTDWFTKPSIDRDELVILNAFLRKYQWVGASLIAS